MKDELKTNRLIVGDCSEVLPTLPDGVAAAMIADPPFNIGLKYKDYDDNKTRFEYLAMLRAFASHANVCQVGSAVTRVAAKNDSAAARALVRSSRAR